MKIIKNNILIGIGKLVDRTRDCIQFSALRIDEIIHPQSFQFEVEGETGFWVITNYPVMYHTDRLTILSTYGPSSPIPPGLVEIRKLNS